MNRERSRYAKAAINTSIHKRRCHHRYRTEAKQQNEFHLRLGKTQGSGTRFKLIAARGTSYTSCSPAEWRDACSATNSALSTHTTVKATEFIYRRFPSSATSQLSTGRDRRPTTFAAGPRLTTNYLISLRFPQRHWQTVEGNVATHNASRRLPALH